MRRLNYNETNKFIKNIILFVITIQVILFFSTILIAQENNVRLFVTEGRAVIINEDKKLAKKRALDEALYLASLRGGAKIDGFSSIDEKTNLTENLIVRPSSQIVDFRILSEKETKTHYNVKIQSAVFIGETELSCKNNNKINLSFLKPKFRVSSKLPALANTLPDIVSKRIFENLKNLEDIHLLDKTMFDFDLSKNTLDPQLDYVSLTDESLSVNNGDYAVQPIISLDFSDSRIHRFSNEIIFRVSLLLYKNSTFQFVERFDYEFSLDLGNETGYQHLDSFYKTSYGNLIEYTNLSLSKFHLRLLDQLKCMPLESKIIFENNNIIVDLGTNQGLYSGTIGLISSSKSYNYSTSDWSVLTVKLAEKNYSILETLNPNISGMDIEGKMIRFLN